MTGTIDKAPAIHDKAANEIRFICECGHVTHIAHPDPFELLSLYQHGMRATCETCRRVSDLELEKVVNDDKTRPCSDLPGLHVEDVSRELFRRRRTYATGKPGIV